MSEGKNQNEEEYLLGIVNDTIDAHLAKVNALKKVYKGYNNKLSYNKNLENSKKSVGDDV